MILPNLREIPSPTDDPLGYDRVWLRRELDELGPRVSVRVADLSEDVVQAIHDSDVTYGNAIMALDSAKRKVASTGEDILEPLRAALATKV